MDDAMTFGEAALYYAVRGIAVFPLKEKSKTPASRNGCLDATDDQSELAAWWKHEPESNIGLACGAVSMLAVLDVDAKHGGLAALEELEKQYGKLPPTWTCCTGNGGYHFYFKHPGPLATIPNSAGKIAPGIDIRGDGGYVAAPPSIHPNGKPYLWEMGGDPDEVYIAELPTWLRAKIVESPAERMKPKELPETVSEGGRADAITSFCGTLRRRGMGAGEISEFAKAWNAKHCVPPLPDAQVDAIARSAARYAPGDPLIAAPATAPAANAPLVGDAGRVDADVGGNNAAGHGPDVPKPARSTGRSGAKLDGPALHATLEEDLPRWMAERNVGINAIGELRDTRTGGLATLAMDELLVGYANHFRRCRQYVAKQYVEEVMSELIRERSKQRRDEVAKRVLSLRGGDDTPVRAWCKAVTGAERELEVAVVRHWMWQVKRSLADLPIEHHLMPILLGPQSSGKSTATRLLCGPLEELACIPASGEMITDPRSIPSLSKFYAGVWDEMEGADRGSIEAIKRAITSAKLTYKPLYTNGSATVRVTMQWFGTSNKSVASMVKDATGNRRFIELTSLLRCDWATIGAIDYDLVWASVDHEAPAPIVPFLPQLVEVQRSQVYRDTVTAWLGEEEWRDYTDADGVLRPARNEFGNGVPSKEVQSRYVRWCDYSREKHPLSASALGMRLKEEGWERSRTGHDDNGYRGWRYFPPRSYVDGLNAPRMPFGDDA